MLEKETVLKSKSWIGKQQFNGSAQVFWNAVKPEDLDGPDRSLRFQLQALFPK